MEFISANRLLLLLYQPPKYVHAMDEKPYGRMTISFRSVYGVQRPSIDRELRDERKKRATAAHGACSSLKSGSCIFESAKE